MGITRRGFFKGALTAAVLALVPSLPGLPEAAQDGRIVGRAVAKPAPNPLFAECVYGGPGPVNMIKLSSQFASLQARELDAKIMAMLDQTECEHPFEVRLEGWRWSEGCQNE